MILMSSSFLIILTIPELKNLSNTFIVTSELYCSGIIFPNTRTYLISRKLILIKLIIFSSLKIPLFCLGQRRRPSMGLYFLI